MTSDQKLFEDRKARAAAWFAELRDRLCAAFERLEQRLMDFEQRQQELQIGHRLRARMFRECSRYQVLTSSVQIRGEPPTPGAAAIRFTSLVRCGSFRPA